MKQRVFYQVSKRLLDVTAASLGLLLLAPAGAVLALIIKLTDRGPIFFSQTRVGQSGKPFRIWKFRSMVVNAEQAGLPLTKGKDPRITVVGHFLRRTKIDELPQLWNVLVGNMSLVGPRPEVPRYVERYTVEQRQILNYKPGITDLASLLFRNEEEILRGSEDVEAFYLKHCLPQKIELNRQYAQRANLFQDIWIILQTVCPYWLGVLAVYVAGLIASFWLSYQLRLDFHVTRADYREFWRALPWVIIPQLIALIWVGKVRGLMSYFSLPELQRICAALALALLFELELSLFVKDRPWPAPSTIMLDSILSLTVLCGVRLLFRLARERSLIAGISHDAQLRRIAVIGTGPAAIRLALDLDADRAYNARVVAFFADDPRTWHKRPHDIPVIGMPECLLNPEWLRKLDEVVVALPDEAPTRLNEIASLLRRLPLKVTFASAYPVVRRLAA